MDAFKLMGELDFGEVHLRCDPTTGLRAIVAIHDSRLGPALGGCRFLPYPDESSALLDALRLARGMTFKAALAGLPHGGGKAVVIRPNGEFDREALFLSFGSFVEDLRGRYITAEDSGTCVEDMNVMCRVTQHVTGIDVAQGGSGDPSPFTALGVRRGIEACVETVLGRTNLEGVHVAVQGVGNVGYYLCQELAALGAELTVTDVDAQRVARVRDEFQANAVGVDQIHRVDCDVFAPCALGGILDDHSIPQLNCSIVAGGANNQLSEPRHGESLQRRRILYAPDYAINAGGLINVAQEVLGYDPAKARERALKIYDTMREIAERSKRTGSTPDVVADEMVAEVLAAAGEPTPSMRAAG